MPTTKLVVAGLFLTLVSIAFVCLGKAIYKFFGLTRSIKPGKENSTNIVPLLMLFPGTYDESARSNYESFVSNLCVALFSAVGAILTNYFFL